MARSDGRRTKDVAPTLTNGATVKDHGDHFSEIVPSVGWMAHWRNDGTMSMVLYSIANE